MQVCLKTCNGSALFHSYSTALFPSIYNRKQEKKRKMFNIRSTILLGKNKFTLYFPIPRHGSIPFNLFLMQLITETGILLVPFKM